MDVEKLVWNVKNERQRRICADFMTKKWKEGFIQPLCLLFFTQKSYLEGGFMNQEAANM